MPNITRAKEFNRIDKLVMSGLFRKQLGLPLGRLTVRPPNAEADLYQSPDLQSYRSELFAALGDPVNFVVLVASWANRTNGAKKPLSESELGQNATSKQSRTASPQLMELIMSQKTLGPAHRSLMSAANDQYHAVVSMNKYGEISHAQALAQVFLENGEAGSKAQAVQMAAQEVAHVTRITRGQQVNRQARKLLDTKAQQGQAQGLACLDGALPK